jgi:hypothetical protein
VRFRHASDWNVLALGSTIAKLSSRHSERDEGHQVIEMRRHFPHGSFGPKYESPTTAQNVAHLRKSFLA